MEIIDPSSHNSGKCGYAGRPDRAGTTYAGCALIAAGLAWLLYNTGVIDPRAFDILFSWQVLMIVAGGYLLAVRAWIAGGVVSGMGALLLAADLFNLHISFSKIVLPLLLVSIGVAMLFGRR